MTTHSDESKATDGALKTASWLPMAIILLAQVQMAFNVNAIPVSVGPISDDLGASATDVGTALVLYSLFVGLYLVLITQAAGGNPEHPPAKSI